MKRHDKEIIFTLSPPSLKNQRKIYIYFQLLLMRRARHSKAIEEAQHKLIRYGELKKIIQSVIENK